MSSNKHIVLLVPGFPKDESDENCTPYLQEFLRALAKERPEWKLQVVALQYPFKKGKYLWNGIQVHALGGANKVWKKQAVRRRAKSLVRKLHAARPIDILHSFWLGEASKLGMQLAHQLKIDWFATAMGQDCKADNRYLRKLDPAKARMIAAVSPRAAELLAENWHGAKVESIAWGLEALDFEAETREIDILGVGSLIPLKRWDRFMRVVSLLRERHPHLKAKIVGGGKLEGELKAMRDKLGLQENLEFLGEMPRSAALALMRKSKVLLHCSDYESMGYAMMEAYQNGAHVVSTRVGIATEMQKWAISSHTFGLSEAVEQFLLSPIDGMPRTDFELKHCLAAYLAHYER